ncbi:hypothetical protein [Synechococcus elongatus]|uniref:Uncharacterized protein n=2 Tax=Synechococcus elongatus TaxID=32046 RepID=Q31MN5_SYNE7|nr:hypothetical protein [Synechococcus elongatus]MBD2687473.1 hypothetical protein [Synechococcus elongatus FACHB-1061]ABB57684.1 conserved hypothetical protein [Synechococcus elongatus PCC 7942 = FACHB-805]AJD57824.1 hypothetical protein M744_08215 [Synechococcus elongatus UTEX 2973]MBD2586399.1 hypothetical protein [Synechococcus elongatus FACHB-242]MBD2706818.1 hypothetical protein [Synechococcus elongatus PCC 7942 = FACHB-805]
MNLFLSGIVYFASFQVLAIAQNPASYTIPLGKTITATPSNLTIQYRSLVADSRCPTGARCVWAGDAEVVLAIAGKDYSFHTTLEPQSHVFGRYRVRLTQVDPYPSLNPQPNSKPAAVTIEIEAIAPN